MCESNIMDRDGVFGDPKQIRGLQPPIPGAVPTRTLPAQSALPGPRALELVERRKFEC